MEEGGPEVKPDLTLKLYVIGDSGAGKTALVDRFVGGTLSESSPSSGDFKTKTIAVDGKTAQLQVHDSMAKDRFKIVGGSPYSGFHGIVIVFDVTDQDSFNNTKQWLQEVDRYAPEGIPRIIVGTKADLASQRAVDFETVKEFAERLGVSYVETSAETGANVDALFFHMGHQINQRLKGEVIDTEIFAAPDTSAATVQPKSQLIDLSTEKKFREEVSNKMAEIKAKPKSYADKLLELKVFASGFVGGKKAEEQQVAKACFNEVMMKEFFEGESLGFTEGDTGAARKLLQGYASIFEASSKLTNIHKEIFEQKKREVIEKAPAEVKQKIQEAVVQDISPKDKLGKLQGIYYDYAGFYDVTKEAAPQIRELMKVLLSELPEDNIARYQIVVGMGQAVGYKQDFSWIGPDLVKELIETKEDEIKQALRDELAAVIKQEASKDVSVLERLAGIRKIIERHYEIPFLRDESLVNIVNDLLSEIERDKSEGTLERLAVMRELVFICNVLDEIDEKKQVSIIKQENPKADVDLNEIRKNKLVAADKREVLLNVLGGIENQFENAEKVLAAIDSIYGSDKNPLDKLDLLNLLLGVALKKGLEFTGEQQSGIREKLHSVSQLVAREFILAARTELKDIDLQAFAKNPNFFNEKIIKMQDTIERAILKSTDENSSLLSLKQWLYIATQCLQEGDYHTAHVIVDALSRQSIQDLLRNPAAKKEKAEYEQLRNFYRPPDYKLVVMAIQEAKQEAIIVPSLYAAVQLVGKAQANKGDTTNIIEPLKQFQNRIKTQASDSFIQAPTVKDKNEGGVTGVSAYNLLDFEEDKAFKQYVERMAVLEIVSRKDKTKALGEIKPVAAAGSELISGLSKKGAVNIERKMDEVKGLLKDATKDNVPEALRKKLPELISDLEEKLQRRMDQIVKEEEKEENKERVNQLQEDIKILADDISYLRAFAKNLDIPVPDLKGPKEVAQPAGFFANIQQRIVEASNFVASIFRRDVEAVQEKKPQASEPEAGTPKAPPVETAAESVVVPPAVSEEKSEILQSITWNDYWKVYDETKAEIENSLSVKGKEEEQITGPLAIHKNVAEKLKIEILDLNGIANLNRYSFELKVNELVKEGRVKGPTTIETAQKTAVARVMEELIHINNTFYKDFVGIEPRVIAFTGAHREDQLVQEFHERYYAILNFFNKVNAIPETDPIKKAEIIAQMLLDDGGKIAKDIVRFTDLKTQVSANYPQQFTGNTQEARAFDNAVILPSQWVTKAVIVLDAVKKEGIDGIDVASNLFKEAASLANKTERVISESVAVKLEQLVAGTSSTSKIPSAVLNAQAEEVEKFLTPQFVNLGGRDKAKSFEQIYALMKAYVEKISGKGGRELTETEVGNIRVILKNLGKLSDFVKQHDPSFAEQQKEIPLGNAIGQLRLAGHKELSEQCSKALLQFNEISISEIVQAEKQTSTPAYLFPGSNITWEKYWETFNRMLEENPSEGSINEQELRVHGLVGKELGIEIAELEKIINQGLDNSDTPEEFQKKFMEYAAGKIAKREKIQEAKAELASQSTELPLDEQTRLVNDSEGLDRIITIIAPKITDESLKGELRQKAKTLFAQEIDEIAKKESISFSALKSFLDKKDRYEKAGFELPDDYAPNYAILVNKLLAGYPVNDPSADLATLVVRLKSFQDGIALLGSNKKDFESRANELKGVCDAKLEASLKKKLIDLFASNDLAAIKFAGKEGALAQKIMQEKSEITDEIVIKKIHVIMNTDGDLLEKAIKLHVLMGNYFEYVGDVSQKLYEEYQLQVIGLTDALAHELYELDRNFVKQLEVPAIPGEADSFSSVRKDGAALKKQFGEDSITNPLIYKITEALYKNGNIAAAVLMCRQLVNLCQKAAENGDVHAMRSIFMLFEQSGLKKTVIPAFLATCTEDEKSEYEKLRQLFDSTGNMKNLRDYQAAEHVSVPYLGVWAQDIEPIVGREVSPDQVSALLKALGKIYQEIKATKESVQDAKVVQKPNWYQDETRVTEQQSEMARVVLGAAIPAEMPKRLPEFSKQDKRFYQTASIEERIKKYEGKEDDASVAAYKLLEALIKFRKESKKVVHEKYLNVLKEMVSKAEGIIERQKSEYDTGRLQHIQPYKDLIAEIVFAKESIDRRVERLEFFVPEAGHMSEWTMFEPEGVDKPELKSFRKGGSAPLPRAERKEKSQEDRRFFSGPLPQPVDKEKAISRKKSTDKVERVDRRFVAGALPNAVQSLEKIVEQLIENPVNAKAVFGKGGKYRTELLGIKNLYLIEKMILAKGDKGEQLRREIRETGLLTSKHMLGTDEKIKGIKQLWQVRLKLLLDPGSAQQVLSSEETRALFKKFSDDAKLHIEDLIRMSTGANEKFSVFEGDGMPVLRSALMKSGIFNVFESSVQRSFISKLQQHFEDAVVDKINDSAKLQEKLQDANFIDDLRANPSQIDRLEEISDITDEQKQVLGALRESANNKSGKWVKGDFYLALHGAVFKNKKLQEYLLARIEKLAAAGDLPDVNTADSNALQNYIEQRLAKFSGEAGHGNYEVEILAESRGLKKIAEKLFKLDEAEFYQAIGREFPTKDENPALGGAATLAQVTAEEKKESTASILQNPWRVEDFVNALQGVEFQNEKLKQYLIEKVKKLPEEELPVLNTSEKVEALQRFITGRLAKFLGTEGVGNYGAMVVNDSLGVKDIAPKLFMLKGDEFYQALDIDAPEKGENLATGGAAALMEAVVVEHAPAAVVAPEMTEQQRNDPVVTDNIKLIDLVTAHMPPITFVRVDEEKVRAELIKSNPAFKDRELESYKTYNNEFIKKEDGWYRVNFNRRQDHINLGTRQLDEQPDSVITYYIGILDAISSIESKLNYYVLNGIAIDRELGLDQQGNDFSGYIRLLTAAVNNERFPGDRESFLIALRRVEGEFEAVKQKIENGASLTEIDVLLKNIQLSELQKIRNYIAARLGDQTYGQLIDGKFKPLSGVDIVRGGVDLPLPYIPLSESLASRESIFDNLEKATEYLVKLNRVGKNLASVLDADMELRKLEAEKQKVRRDIANFNKQLDVQRDAQREEEKSDSIYERVEIPQDELRELSAPVAEPETQPWVRAKRPAQPEPSRYQTLTSELQKLLTREENIFKPGQSGRIVLKGAQLEGISSDCLGTGEPEREVIIRYFAPGETNTIKLDDLIRRINYLCDAGQEITADGNITKVREKFIEFAKKNFSKLDTETGEAFDELAGNAKKMFLELQKDLVAVAYPGMSLPKAIKALDKKVKEISIRDGRPTVIHVMADGMVSANIPKFSADPAHPAHAKSYPGTYRSSEERGVTPNSAFEVTGYINDEGNVEVKGGVSRSTSWSVLGLKGEKRQKLSYYQAEAELRNALSLMDLPDGATVNVHSMMLLTPVYRPSVEGIGLVKVFYAGETEQMQNQIYSARMLDGKELELADGRKVTVNINVTNTSVKPPKRFMGLNEGVQEQVNNIGFAKFIKNQYESLVNAYPQHKAWLDANCYREPSQAIIKLEAELKAAYSALFDALETPAGKAAKAKVEKLEAQLSKAYGKHYEDVKIFWKAGGPAAADIPEGLRQNKQFLYFADALKLYYSGDYVKQKTHAYLFVTAMTRANELAGVVVAKNCKTGKDRTKESIDQDNLALQYERKNEGKPLLSTSPDLRDHVAENLQTLREQGTGQEVIKYTVPGGLPVSMKDNEWEKKPARKTSKMSKCHKIRPSLRDIFNHWRKSITRRSKVETETLQLEMAQVDDPVVDNMAKLMEIKNKVLAAAIIMSLAKKGLSIPDEVDVKKMVDEINGLISENKSVMPDQFLGLYKQFLEIVGVAKVINDIRAEFIIAVVAENKSPIKEQDFAERIKSANSYDDLNTLWNDIDRAIKEVDDYAAAVLNARTALDYLPDESEEIKSIDAEWKRLFDLRAKYVEQSKVVAEAKRAALFEQNQKLEDSVIQKMVGKPSAQESVKTSARVEAWMETETVSVEVVRISMVAERGLVNGSEKPKQDAVFVYRPDETDINSRFEKISDKGKIIEALKSDDHVIVVKNDGVSYTQPKDAEKLNDQQMRELVQKMVEETYERFKPEKASDITYEGSAELKKMARELMQAEITKRASAEKAVEGPAKAKEPDSPKSRSPDSGRRQ